MKKYRVCLDWQKWERKPANSREEAGRISYRIASQEQELTISQLAQSLLLGQTWTPAIFNVCPEREVPYRHASLFKEMQLLVVDIDSGDHTPESILELCNKLGHNGELIKPAILHSSFTYTKEKPKWRIAFALDKPIGRAKNALACLRFLTKHFGGDPACADIARLFYGTHAGAYMRIEPSWVFSRDALEAMAEQAGFFDMAMQDGIKLEAVPDEQAQIEAITKLSPQQRRILQFAIEDARKLIADPVGEAGSGYMAAWKAGFKLGQFACLHEAYIVQVLEKERALHSEAWQGGKHDYAQIMLEGVSWARQHGRF